MKTITVLTATRAEYGLLRPLILKMRAQAQFCVRVVVTGAHLSPEFGCTFHEIEQDGIEIDKKIEILLSSDSPSGISKSMGLAMIGFAEYFEDKPTDALLVLGDRYETLAVCCAAMNARIPIIHLYGGETTEGAVDEAIRHAITKMSYLHLTSTEQYRKRVIQLGESPDRVFTVGSLGIENVMNAELLGRQELGANLGFDLAAPYAVMTFHPVTLECNQAAQQFTEILAAISLFPKLRFIFTKANADASGRIINQMIDEYAETHDNVFAIDSLGMRRYLSAVKNCEMVIGNSSSGLIEVPSFHVPTINIGNRQKGRLQAQSVLNCEPEREAIVAAMNRAEDVDFRKQIQTIENPYGDGNTTDKIIKAISEKIVGDSVDLKKTFYDVDFEVQQ